MSPLSSEDCRTLIDVARRAIACVVQENCLPDLPPFSGILAEPAGAFVTIHRQGRLRGCVGQMEDPLPLAETVARAAVNAALHDFRFRPVAVEEVASLEIEISVLSPLELIAPEAVVVGRHGLMVVRGAQRGLLLPQVAIERKWSNIRFLEEVCIKADLPRDAWRDLSTRLFSFTAHVFSDADVGAATGR